MFLQSVPLRYRYIISSFSFFYLIHMYVTQTADIIQHFTSWPLLTFIFYFSGVTCGVTRFIYKFEEEKIFLVH